MRPTAGLSFKPDHFDEAMSAPADGLWFEVHAENYMVAGGPRVAMLSALRERFPISIHGVGLSLAGAADPDAAHLRRFRALIDRFEPTLVSEHLAWSQYEGVCYPDLLPFPRTNAALERLCQNIDITQNALGRPILVENPALYVALEGHAWEEAEFLSELVRRTGCGLLLDVNNIHVSAHNLGYDPTSYFNNLPAAAIGEIHLAGHSVDPHLGEELLIDSHDAPVSPEVWALYTSAVEIFGSRPTLIERDDNLPAFEDLMAERESALDILHSADFCRA